MAPEEQIGVGSGVQGSVGFVEGQIDDGIIAAAVSTATSTGLRGSPSVAAFRIVTRASLGLGI